jgi:hypothetical protein
MGRTSMVRTSVLVDCLSKLYSEHPAISVAVIMGIRVGAELLNAPCPRGSGTNLGLHHSVICHLVIVIHRL